MTHKRMFFYFSFIQLFSEEPRHLLIMRLACLLFFRGSSLGSDCLNLFSAIYQCWSTTHLGFQSSQAIISCFLKQLQFYFLILLRNSPYSSECPTHIPPQAPCSPFKPQQITVPVISQREQKPSEESTFHFQSPPLFVSPPHLPKFIFCDLISNEMVFGGRILRGDQILRV